MPLEEQAHIEEFFSGCKTWCSLWKREFEYRDFLIRAARRWLTKDPKTVERQHNFFQNRANPYFSVIDFVQLVSPALLLDKVDFAELKFLARYFR